MYEENAVMDGARMKQGRRLKPPAFQELEDIPNVQHVKLYTFISATIKNLVSKKGGSSDFLDEPPSVGEGIEISSSMSTGSWLSESYIDFDVLILFYCQN